MKLKNKTLALLFILTLFSNVVMGQVQVVPALQKWTNSKGFFKLKKEAKILTSATNFLPLQKDILQFQKDIQTVTGHNLQIAKGKPKKGDIVFKLSTGLAQIGKEGYTMKVENYIVIEANTTDGLFFGMQTLLQLFTQGPKVEKGFAIDYPTINQRGFMMDVARDYFEVEYIETVIRKLAWLKMNFIHIHFTDAEAFRLKSELFPGLAHPTEHYTKDDIRRLQDYAAKFHITLIPEIEMPAHASSYSTYNSYLAFDCPSMRVGHKVTEDFENSDQVDWGFSVDITRDEVRAWLKALLAEWVPLFDAPVFHIGGDEWQYDANKYACPELMQAMKDKGYEYPGDVFVEFVNEMNQEIKSYGKTTHIWNWWRFSPDIGKENEVRMNRTSIQPDKDIVVHVWNHPRLQEILDDGYKVIITSEEGPEALYVTPYKGTGKPGDYGVFDTKNIYEEWAPIKQDNILGYKVCLWADTNEGRPDDWYEQFYGLPIAVLSEKTWGSPTSKTIETFEERVNTVGTSINKKY